MRAIKILSVLTFCLLGGGAAWAEMGDDGLHKQPWFLDSFLELQDDLAEATAEGKDLIILVEQKGCPYCRELHEVNFARPEIVDFINAHYVVVQLDMFGSRAVVDFDGEELEERALALKWGLNFTPTTLIFTADTGTPETVEDTLALALPGYLKPFHYMTALEFVAADEYQDIVFQRYLQAKIQSLVDQGIEPDVW